ncbi:Acyl-CoA--sterol O-acyltransferase 1 [Citrus sinensis]|uniref:Acyl-CoA--sterol O-acyltransferase 1 n=1 Tax=Citrus sinensis TaxID=2711 RepID=A0ACB8LLK6_CITSI|nr:Acyl-CoA--sterol O-acyltransferase 1 [Citrus sinensis]
MEGEMKNFIKVWLSVTISLCYCHAIGKMVSKGIKRLSCLIPVVCLFLYLPLCLTSVHIGGTTAFFITWLANFKLLLFAFGLGPLSSHPPISLPLFVIVSCLPIKIQNNNNPIPGAREGRLNYTIKGLLVAILVQLQLAYEYSDYILSVHPKLILLVYSLHMYFLLELILAASAAVARAMLGLELEPQFKKPHLSTSLQDFWGKRWNLMVTGILRPTVYKPSLHVFTRLTGRKWAPLPAIFATFLVSGFMHQLIFFYLGRGAGLKATWEVTWVFVLHGFCVAVEVGLKKAVAGRFRLPRIITVPLTAAFVMVTSCWLFFPQFSHCKLYERAFEEYAALGAFFGNVWSCFVRACKAN